VGTRADFDFAVIGAGILGLASALTLQQRVPGARVLVVEKESGVAAHQTGHNSGVIHAGVYYEPGSLKARLCRAGLLATIDFCRAHNVAFEQCGKLIVAVTPAEIPRLRALAARAAQNGAPCQWLEGREVQALEPAIAGVAALKVEETGIVDYPGMCQAMAARMRAAGGTLCFDTPVSGIEERAEDVLLRTPSGVVTAAQLVVCAGLQADRMLRLSGFVPDFAIVPFRGDYYRLVPRHNTIVRHLIYPVPDPTLPFLGIHLTRMIDGSVTLGPSAMLALAREDYRKTGFNLRDALALAGYPGVWRLLRRYRAAGLQELGWALSRRRYLEAAQRYAPALTIDDLQPYPAGIRAQAVSPQGALIHDFLLKQTPRMLHVCNAPSPAATAALPIASEIVTRLLTARG
jgi:L-2-hydroxyglutarate oxidase